MGRSKGLVRSKLALVRSKEPELARSTLRMLVRSRELELVRSKAHMQEVGSTSFAGNQTGQLQPAGQLMTGLPQLRKGR